MLAAPSLELEDGDTCQCISAVYARLKGALILSNCHGSLALFYLQTPKLLI